MSKSVKISSKHGWKTQWSIYKFADTKGIIASLSKKGASIASLMALASKGVIPSGLKLSKAELGYIGYIGKESFSDNVGLNEGIAELLDLAFGLGTPTAFDTTNGYLGVGNSATGEQPTDTGLIGASKKYVVFDDTYPSRSNQTVTARSTFASADANYAWEEYTLSNGNSDSSKNLNRKTASKGTKSSGETWILEMAITVS